MISPVSLFTFDLSQWSLVSTECFHIACSAGVFWARECTFSYMFFILDLVTVEDWGEEIFAEGVGVKWKNERVGRCPTPHCTNPLPVKHLITIQAVGIESLIYLAFRSKITPALQASFHMTSL